VHIAREPLQLSRRRRPRHGSRPQNETPAAGL